MFFVVLLDAHFGYGELSEIKIQVSNAEGAVRNW